MRTLLLMIALAAAVASARAEPLETAAVERRAVELGYPAEAVVEAVRQATVAAQVQGRIVEVRRDAGEAVRQGEVLMRIDEREAAQALAAAEAQVAQAQAGAANARASYERTKNLFARKFVSQAALDQALAAHRAAEASLQAAIAGRGQAGTAKGFATVTSPIDGVVAARHAELGEMATPGKPLVTVFDPAGLRVIASVPQYRRAEVARAARAVVEFPDSGQRIAATRVEVMPTADARTHSVALRLYLPIGARGVVPGQFARAHFVVGSAEKLLLPAAAVVRRGEVTGVYVVAGERVSLRQVRLGDHAEGAAVEVLAGVAAGERVALDPVKATLARSAAAAR